MVEVGAAPLMDATKVHNRLLAFVSNTVEAKSARRMDVRKLLVEEHLTAPRMVVVYDASSKDVIVLQLANFNCAVLMVAAPPGQSLRLHPRSFDFATGLLKHNVD